MSDFMPWFYDSFICPQLDEIFEGDYISDFQAVLDRLSPDLLHSWERCEEFLSIQAFLLGYRTGAGLSAATGTSAPPASTRP